MQIDKQKGLKMLSIFIVVVVVALGGYFGYKYSVKIRGNNQVACTMEAKLCPDGSSVGRTGPKCEFSACPESKSIIYKNDEYGFEITLQADWKNYTIDYTKRWDGLRIDTAFHEGPDYDGQMVFIVNPQWKADYNFAGIPVMVVTKDVWDLIAQEKVSVSAAPIGPAKIGENSKYVFATPPRYIGFAENFPSGDQTQEVYNIVKTFKAF